MSEVNWKRLRLMSRLATRDVTESQWWEVQILCVLTKGPVLFIIISQ